MCFVLFVLLFPVANGLGLSCVHTKFWNVLDVFVYWIFKNSFIYLFWLNWVFVAAQASHHGSCSCFSCGSQAVGHRLRVVAYWFAYLLCGMWDLPGWRDWMPSIGRQILYHWAPGKPSSLNFESEIRTNLQKYSWYHKFLWCDWYLFLQLWHHYLFISE